MVSLRVRKWIQRRKKSYKLATYKNFARLNKALEEDTKQKLSSLSAKSIQVSFDSIGDDGSTPIVGLKVNRSNLPDAKINECILLINSQTNKQEARGSITNIDSNIVQIKLENPFTIGKDGNPGDKEFKILFDEQSVLKRKRCIEDALRKFKRISCSLPIHKYLLGYYKDESNLRYKKARVVPVNGLLPLKGVQILAVEQSLKRRVSLIEGVAGSGKTLVAANIACSTSRLRGQRVLICSPSQSTVDKLTDLLTNTGCIKIVNLQKRPVKTLKLMMKSHKKFISIKDCSLDVLINQAIYKLAWNRLKRSPYESRREQVKLHSRAVDLVLNSSNWLRRKIELEILSKADVVCCTLSETGDACLKSVKFDMLIIDDVQIANEIDCTVPLMKKGLKQVTLLSDMRIGIRLARSSGQQPNNIKKPLSISNSIRPTIKYSSGKNKPNLHEIDLEKIKDSNSYYFYEPGKLFEKLLKIGLAPVALKNQYRMQETLAAFPNYRFYLSRLKTDPSTNRELEKRIFSDYLNEENRFNWLPKRDCLTALFDSLNIIDTAREIMKKLVSRENICRDQIGIITNDLTSINIDFDGVKIGTVYEFFGQERDFIVLLTLETNQDSTESKSINYLVDDAALSAAITRARLGLFIVASVEDLLRAKVSSETCKEEQSATYCDSWRDFVKYYAKNSLIT